MDRISFIRINRFSKCLIGVLFLWSLIVTTHKIREEQPTRVVSNNQEIRKFVFKKNHLCASSTVANIIFRFAHDRNLRVASVSNEYDLSQDHNRWNTSIQHSPDIVLWSGRWNRTKMPLDPTVPTFTIIRNPVDVFIAMFYDSEGLRDFYGAYDIHDMVNKIQLTPFMPRLRQRWMNNMGRNQLSWELGLATNIQNDRLAVEREIERLDNEFNLVMITERMDESLVVLKELLHWPFESLIHLDLKRRKPYATLPLSKDERTVLAEWLETDMQIYNHFWQRFSQQVSELDQKHLIPWYRGFGRSTPYVQRETQMLKKANIQLYDRCVTRELEPRESKGDLKSSNNDWIDVELNQQHEDCLLHSVIF